MYLPGSIELKLNTPVHVRSTKRVENVPIGIFLILENFCARIQARRNFWLSLTLIIEYKKNFKIIKIMKTKRNTLSIVFNNWHNSWIHLLNKIWKKNLEFLGFFSVFFSRFFYLVKMDTIKIFLHFYYIKKNLENNPERNPK